MMRTNCVRRTSNIILYCVSKIVKVMKSRRRQQNKNGENKRIFIHGHRKRRRAVPGLHGVMVKFTLKEATKVQSGSRGIALLFR